MDQTPSPDSKSSTPLWIIAGGVIVAGLYVGRAFLVPIAFAILLNIVCRPAVRVMHRQLHLPASIAAGLVVLMLVALITTAGYVAAGPVERWWETAPAHLEQAQQRLQQLGGPLRQMNELQDRVDHLASPATQTSTAPAIGGDANQPKPQPATPGPAQPNSAVPGIAVTIFGGISVLLSGVIEVLFLTYLLLAADGLFLRKFRDAMASDRAKHAAGEVVHESESLILRYLIVTFVINLGQAAVVGVALMLLGLQHALMWAMLTVVLEFIPYLGAAVMIVLLSAAALTQFDHLGHASLVPVAYVVISMIQNNLISPLLYGNHLKLNAVAIIVGVIFFWFLWGIPGAFVAVPILAITRIACEKSERWRALGSYLAD